MASKTKVKLTGFEIDLPSNIFIGEFFQELETVEDKETTCGYKTCVLYCDVHEQYIVGLLLSYKGDKKLIASKRDAKGHLLLSKKELEADEHRTEANLFCINPITLRGLYYNYFGSASLKSLETFFSGRSKTLKERLIREKVRELTDFGKKSTAQRAQKEANKFYKGDFKLSAIVTPADVTLITAMFASLNSVSLDAIDAFANDSKFSPIVDVSKAAQVKFKMEKGFKIGPQMDAIKKALPDYLKPSKFHALKFVGKGHFGEDLTTQIGENIKEFGYTYFDEYVDKLPNPKWADYLNCTALSDLLKRIQEEHIIFGKKPADKVWKIKSAKDEKLIQGTGA